MHKKKEKTQIQTHWQIMKSTKFHHLGIQRRPRILEVRISNISDAPYLINRNSQVFTPRKRISSSDVNGGLEFGLFSVPTKMCKVLVSRYTLYSTHKIIVT